MGFLSDIFGITGAKKAATNAANANRTEANNSFNDVSGYLDPYVTQGTNAYGRLANLSGANGVGAQTQAFGDFQYSPDYKVRFDQGATALQKILAGSRGLNSGAAMKGAIQYGADQGTQGYNDYYNRLAGLGNTGFQATGALSNARMGTATNIMGANTNEGNALANASLAGGNMLMGGLSSLAGLAGMGMGGLPNMAGSFGAGGTAGSIGGTMGSQAAYNPYGNRYW